MKFRLALTILACLSGLCLCCQRKAADTGTEPVQKPTEEYMTGIHREIVRNEAKDIELVIRRYGWQMQRTPSGLYYEIFQKGSGKTLSKGDAVRLRCNISLLDGTPVYASDKDGIKELVIERSDEIAGLQEALQLMQRGCKAHLIIPPHLAYGSLGDGGDIPGFATLVYSLEILP